MSASITKYSRYNEKYLSLVKFSQNSYDIFNIEKRKGVVIMRVRVNHRRNVKGTPVDKNFWKEYSQRGFRLDPANDGIFHPDILETKFSRKSEDTYEVVISENARFNIVPVASFMKTVSQIEGLGKYKLFK